MDLENFKYNLTKLKKCNQYWDEMQPVIGGRHCAKCEKTIVDFSKMSFTDIAFFMAEAKQPICGYYLPQQLAEMKSAKKQWPLAIGISSILLSTQVANAAIENTISILPIVKGNDTVRDNTIENHTSATRAIDTIKVIGRIFFHDTLQNKNLPVGFASIIIKGTKTGTASNEQGEFQLNYTANPETENFVLIISSVGFDTKELPIKYTNNASIDLGTILLNPYSRGIIEFYVLPAKHQKWRRFWRKIKKPFTKKK